MRWLGTALICELGNLSLLVRLGNAVTVRVMKEYFVTLNGFNLEMNRHFAYTTNERYSRIRFIVQYVSDALFCCIS